MQELLGLAEGNAPMIFLKRNPCNQCDRSFRTAEQRMQHEQIVHGKDIPYECTGCGQSFSNMYDMREHLKRHHPYKKS